MKIGIIKFDISKLATICKNVKIQFKKILILKFIECEKKKEMS